jgi:hypothetical protein
MTNIETYWKFFEVKSLVGVHDGIHAIKNIMSSKVILREDFCKSVGIDPNLKNKEIVSAINDLPEVRRATETIKQDPEETWVCLAVCDNCKYPGISYRPAVLICRN